MNAVALEFSGAHSTKSFSHWLFRKAEGFSSSTL
jgi:hypothetical protein